MESELKIHRDRNVYILGAGFSCDAGFPIVSNFLNCMRDACDWLKDARREKEYKSVERVFQFRLRAASAGLRINLNVENIEDLFSLASANDNDSLKNDVVIAIAATLDYVKSHLKGNSCKVCNSTIKQPPSWLQRTDREMHEMNTYSCSPYHLYAGIISRTLWPGPHDSYDTVITFNYDTVLEDALLDIGVKFHYGFSESEGITFSSSKSISPNSTLDALPILKLHGSVNWGTKSNPDRINVFERYQNILESDYSVLLVPPTWRKAFDGALLKVWDSAVKALSMATRIVIIGFSMPATDAHFKYLLAAGLQQNISLRKIIFINPEIEQLEKNVNDIIRPDLKKQGILAPLESITTEDFFLTKKLNAIDLKLPHAYSQLSIARPDGAIRNIIV